MNGKEVINLLYYSANYCNTIILRVINSEDKGPAMNEGHSKAHEWEVRNLDLRVSAERETHP